MHVYIYIYMLCLLCSLQALALSCISSQLPNKNLFGAESGRRRSTGQFQRAFGVIFRCGSGGTILRTPKSIFFCFTTEARPYLIGRCHIFVASINVYEIGPSDSFLGQPFEQVSQGQNRHMVFSRKQPYPSPAEHTICL